MCNIIFTNNDTTSFLIELKLYLEIVWKNINDLNFNSISDFDKSINWGTRISFEELSDAFTGDINSPECNILSNKSKEILAKYYDIYLR